MAISHRFQFGVSAFAVALAALVPTAAMAQTSGEQDETPAASDSTIVVTGSRVRVAAPVGSAITALGREDLAASGRVTLDRAIKELPQVFDLGVSENSRGQSGGAGNIVYGNSINLRGIGPNATLILIDGHRVVNNSRSTDPSVLPTLGVERVEIVADGASAIYGSDAIAGVVNLVPRRTFDGIEAFARAGFADEGGYHEYALGAAVGKTFERGQVMLAFEHVTKTNLDGGDRDFFRSDQRSFGGNDYSVTRCAPGTITAGGISYAIPAGGITAANAASLVAGTSNRCDDLQGQDLIPRQKYSSVSGTFTYELTDWMAVFFDGFFSRRTFDRLPAYSSATLTVPQTNAFFVRPLGFAGTSTTVALNYRAFLPRNLSFGHGESWQITPGLRFKLPHDWQVEVLLGHGRTDDNATSLLGVNNAALTAALASSDPAAAFDPYGLNRTSASVIGNIFNQISISPTIGRFTGYEARANGTVLTLPGGEVKLAVGYEGQQFTVDLGLARGNPGTPVVFTTRSRRVDSGYAELYVPLFGDGNATAGFQKLDLVAAVRYDKYSDVGGTTNPKFGMNWTPIEGLLLRGSYGTSFRAPTLPQIYGNTNQLFNQNYQNPAGGAPIPGVARSGGNLDLSPETATTWSFGADYQASPNFKLSATFWSVDYKNQVIALLSDLSLLTRASQYDGTGLIVQGAAAGQAVAALVAQGLAVAGTFPGGNPLNVTVYVDGRSQNLGRSVTRGIDFTLNYRIPTSALGTFGLNLAGSYLTTYRTKQTPTAPYIAQLNLIFQPLKFKLRGTLNWNNDSGLGAFLRVSHLTGYINNTVTPNQEVAGYTPIDLGVSYKFGSEHQVTIGAEVRNLFNFRPPYVNLAPGVNGSGGYDATASDPVGRQFAASLRVKW